MQIALRRFGFLETKYESWNENCTSIMRIIVESNGGFRGTWPTVLWEQAESELTKNALDQMDLLQRIHLAREPNDDDAQPDTKNKT